VEDKSSAPAHYMKGCAYVKVISLLEPWASLVAVGAKHIETRSWATKYRGPLGIHASKGRKPENMNLAWKEPFYAALESIHREVNGKPSLRYHPGCIISTCNLVDCLEMTPEFLLNMKSPELDFGHYEIGRFAWILEDVRRLPEPILAKGKLGLWEFDHPES